MYDTLLTEFRQQEKEESKKVFNVKPENFNELLALIRNDIAKEDTAMRKPLKSSAVLYLP